MIERTFVLLKPETIKRGLVGEIIKRIEEKKFKIVAMKMLRSKRSQAEKIYIAHKNKPFFNKLIRSVIAGPIVVMIVEKEDAVASMRELIGATDPAEAKPGTIRGDLGITKTLNLIHAAATPEDAKREMAIFFKTNYLDIKSNE